MPQADEPIFFIPGKGYRFDPPLSTLGFPIGVIRGEPERLSFAEGTCVLYSAENQTHVFRGIPAVDDPGISEKKGRKYFFHIEIGGVTSKVIPLDQ